MRNRYLEKWSSIVKIKVEGKNINNYIKKLMKKKIKIIKIIPISYKEVNLILNVSEYQKLTSIKTVMYKITILSYHGKLKVKKELKSNSTLIIFLLLGITLIIFLSRVVFKIEVIHQDKSIRNLLITELNKYDIKKYSFKKNYQELEKIENKILENNKDKLEWIEITETGTKYIVRVEERKINKKSKEKKYQNIISKKDAIITNIKAISGEKLKETNDYVKKGDIIIAGYITLPDNSKVPTVAEGEVLGEVWYKVKIDYPFIYQEKNLTGNTKIVYTINFFNKSISLFNFKKYKTFSKKNKILLSRIFPNISLIKEKQYETKVLDDVYTEDIAKNKAIDYIKQKLLKDNHNIKEIKDVKILTSSSDEDSIKMNIFIKSIENIGKYSKLDEEELNNNVQKKRE